MRACPLMFYLKTVISDLACLILFKARDDCGSVNWLGENIRAVIVSHLLFTLDPKAELQQDKEIKLVHIHTVYCFVFFFPQMKHLQFECYTWMCTFETSGVVKPHCTHSYATEVWISRGKTRRVVPNNTVQKLEPLRASSLTSCTFGLCRAAEQPHLLHAFSSSSAPSFSRPAMTSTSACLVAPEGRWLCKAKKKRKKMLAGLKQIWMITMKTMYLYSERVESSVVSGFHWDGSPWYKTTLCVHQSKHNILSRTM